MPPEREVIDCPRCNGTGTFVYRDPGGVWWKDQHRTCAWCRGHRRIYKDSVQVNVLADALTTTADDESEAA